MRLFVYVCLLCLWRVRGDRIGDSIDEQCLYSVYKYQYISKTIFHNIPTSISDQTTLNIQADVYHYQAKSPCNQSFVKLHNLTINRYENTSSHTDVQKLEKTIFQAFIQTNNLLQNSTDDLILSDNYTNQYRRIKFIQTKNGRFIGNGLFSNYFLNKLFSPTKITCEIEINLLKQVLHNNNCSTTTAGILTITRQINYVSNETLKLKNENFIRNLSKLKTTKNDFDRLLKRICVDNDRNSDLELIDILNNELSNEDLNKILFEDSNQYSICEWTRINRSIVSVIRSQATKYILTNFANDQIIIQNHLDIIEKESSKYSKDIFRQYLNHTYEITSLVKLRMLILISDDNLTIEYGLNRNNHIKYRVIAFRTLNDPKLFHQQFRRILNNEEESSEIRIIAFQMLLSSFDSSEIGNLIKTVQSNQLRFYIKSLFKQSSIWLANSGLYQFPFGNISIIFNETSLSFIPNIIQLEFANNKQIDIYINDWEILLLFDRKSIIRFGNINEFFTWLNNDPLVEMETIDGFYLKINLKTEFNPFRNFFTKSSTEIILKIQHGLGDMMTGYEIRFSIESNFKINVHQSQTSTSYIWSSIQKENIFIKIEQIINPLVSNKPFTSENIRSSASTKDFCYIIPHFDSKICLSFLFERLWPTSISIRLLSDDPSLIYNLTRSTNSLVFNIQQENEKLRSYRLLQKHHEHSLMPYYLEFSTPTINYTLFLNWTKLNIISFEFFNNHRLISNGSGLYQYDPLLRNLSVNLTEISPNNIGKIFLNSNGNLTLHVLKFFGGDISLKVNQFSNWDDVQIEINAEKNFFFLKQNFLLNFSYKISQSFFNLTLRRNANKEFQWTFIKNNSNINHIFILNTSVIELNHHTQGYYKDLSNMKIESAIVVNEWSFWNISGVLNNGRQVQIRINPLFIDGDIDYRSIQLGIKYLNHRIMKFYSYINQANLINLSLEIPGCTYESQGQLSANYTNFSLDFPIIENKKKKSNIHLDFSTFSNNLILNLTSNIRNQYAFTSFGNFTFNNYYYLYQLNIESLFKMMHHQLFSFHSFAQYIENSTILQSLNGSIILPSLFFSKPFLFAYSKDSQLFIQLFEWANFTRGLTNSNITTNFGLQIYFINNLSRKLLIEFEQKFFGQYYSLTFEIDRNWLISFNLNNNTKFEFISSPIDSVFLIKQINLKTNKTSQLPINYYTDNQTLIRIEISFSKYFSRFFNDFILDLSLKNHTLKFYCYIPIFKREFLSLTWKRYIQKDLFHFNGLIEIYFLRRRRLINYEYNWNLASIYFWKFDSCLILFSLDPIQWNFNLTNDYLWNGKWAADFRLLFGHRRELIKFNHKYSYRTLLSNLLFNIDFVNSNYYLDVNYYHSNSSIRGTFLKNKNQHEIDGYWNKSDDTLQLNTQYLKSMTNIKANLFKSIIENSQQKMGILLQRTTKPLRNDTQLMECNPYIIIQRCPRLFLLDYYTLNDGLSTMMFEWSTYSYLSWNYTGHGHISFPLTKFEIDLRTKYIFRLHTSTFKYSSIYNPQIRQLTIRREPLADDADDRFHLKLKSYPNQTFLIHLQIFNNHYRILANPSNENHSWKLNGYFQNDPFNGSLLISKSDWLLSSKLDFNSTFSLSTGQYVQLIPTSDSQIAFEIFLQSRFHFVFQYAGLQSLIALKFFHNSSNIDLYFSSKSINQTIYDINFQLNNLINQQWILKLTEERFYLYNHNYEFLFNGSIDDFLFQHAIQNKQTKFFLNKNTFEFSTNDFGFIISNLSVDTTKYLHLYHRLTKQNLTIHYYKSGRFFRENFMVQTPIYDINMIYYPNDDENQYIKIIFEFLPLQMSSFNLVRGRTFRIGYQTKQKQCILEGNLAFGIEDIDNLAKLIMNERWKLYYGYEKYERIFIKWNINMDLDKKILYGKINIQDPNGQITTPIASEINGYLNDMMLVTNIRTIYSSSDNLLKPIILQLTVDQRILTQQYISLKLIHEFSKTNLSFTLDRYPQRKVLIRLKPNNFSEEKTLLHLYANTTESQLKFLLILADYLNLNLTLPKSYPETGIIHSSLFIDNEEYFDGRLDTAALRLRSKDYLFNVTLNQLILQNKSSRKLLASIYSRWIDPNSSTGLITIFTQNDYKRMIIPVDQSSQQKTWLSRFKQFLFYNNLTYEFFQDFQEFVNLLKIDEEFDVQLFNYFKFDDDLQLAFEKINYTSMILIETLFQISSFSENLLQEYLNNLTCLTNHQNVFHLDLIQLVNLTINTFVYETIYRVNKSLIMFNHFTHYPHSVNAILNYLTNEILLTTYKFITNFYLETKRFFLSKFLQYTHELDFILKLSPLISNSITYLLSDDIRTIISICNDRLRRFLQIWLNSPIEYKILRTIVTQLTQLIEKIRFYIDDKLDFLLPTLKIYTPLLTINGTHNQTFLLTWSKDYNLTNSIDEE